MDMLEKDYLALISVALHPDDMVTLALAGVIAMRHLRKPPYDVPVAGMDSDEIAVMKRLYFPEAEIDLDPAPLPSHLCERTDEFDDLLALLMEHRSIRDRKSRWLAHAVATASMGENHLWQDMGLPNRATLSRLMATYFTSLSRRNVNDMKWKKFFYRQLCESAGLTVCRSPSCSVCSDYSNCFGNEESVSGHFLITA